MLSVVVVVTAQFLAPRPHLLFREATVLGQNIEPGVGKFLYSFKTSSDGSPHLAADNTNCKVLRTLTRKGNQASSTGFEPAASASAALRSIP